MAKTDWQEAAINLRTRAANAERKAALWRQGMNLYINQAVVWFHESRPIDDGVHKFGVGIAHDVEVADFPERALGKTENLPVVFWLTSWGENKIISAFSLTDFRALSTEKLPDPNLKNTVLTAISRLDEVLIEPFDCPAKATA